MAGLACVLLVGLLIVPVVALAWSSSPSAVLAGLTHPMFVPALVLSLRTTVCSLALTVALGTPLAWWLAVSDSRTQRVVAVLVDLPIVIPPAVMGVALLQTFGRQGLLGPVLDSIDVAVPF
ncbi:unnamed protein product, partial [Laminaria digitata]